MIVQSIRKLLSVEIGHWNRKCHVQKMPPQIYDRRFSTSLFNQTTNALITPCEYTLIKQFQDVV